jgi:hypothetical protein
MRDAVDIDLQGFAADFLLRGRGGENPQQFTERTGLGWTLGQLGQALAEIGLGGGLDRNLERFDQVQEPLQGQAAPLRIIDVAQWLET